MAVLNKILDWIKANPVNVACVVVMLAGMSSLFWLIMPARAKSRDGLKDKGTQYSQVQKLLNNRVEVPNNDPDEPTIDIPVAVTESVVKEMGKIYGRMTDGIDRLMERVVAFNRDGQGGEFAHKPLVEGFFPEADQSQIFLVQRSYKQSLIDLHKRLKSGVPPSSEYLVVKVAPGANAIPPTTNEEAEAMLKKLAATHVNVLKDELAKFQVYAPAAPADLNPQSSNWVFTVSPIAYQTEQRQLTPGQLWEAQMNFWIQQDIVNAIVLANNKQPGSVLSNPVKALTKITVDPRYIGVALRTLAGDEPVMADANSPLPHDFGSSQTGRVSNRLYDVRQASVTMTVDLKQLPAVLNAFTQANLLTADVKRITVVDQAQAMLTQNMLYGNSVDIAEVELEVQSLWMRRWTAGHDSPEHAGELAEKFDPGLMPDPVRWRLGLPTRDPNYVPATDDGQGEPVQEDFIDEFDDDFGA